jgi:molybdenum cofactor cytidylyltransferase
MSLTLAEALRLNTPCITAFIGSGGKTTAIFQLARQIKPPVIVTATSHMGAWQLTYADRHIIATDINPLIDPDFDPNQVILVTGEIEGGRTRPVSEDVLQRLREICRVRSIPLLIEADGSRQKPLKAWAEHEPTVPAFVDVVVEVVGMNGLGRPLSEENVHRAHLFSEQSQLGRGEIVTRTALTHILLHQTKPWDRLPASVRRAILLNQADTPEQQAAARGMAGELLSKFHAVLISSLIQKKIFAVHEPVAGVVLAAGESTRYGRPKQFLDWRGESFVRVVARRALEAGLSPVLVVTGSGGREIEQVMVDLDVQIVGNQNWERGQSESIRAGIRVMTAPSNHPGACIFLLVDQPQITPAILQALTEKHAEGLYSIIAPLVMDRRANPVLFDKRTFPDLLTLQGDVGGRAIFHKHPVEYLPWHDDRLLLDVDTPEQYRRLLEDETL